VFPKDIVELLVVEELNLDSVDVSELLILVVRGILVSVFNKVFSIFEGIVPKLVFVKAV
jgi:hypothetical protein